MSCAEDSETSVSDLGHLILVGTESEAMVSRGTFCTKAVTWINHR